MKRKNIEDFLSKLWNDWCVYVQAFPVQAFFVGLAAGFVLALLWGLFIPLVCIIALILFVLWLLAEPEVTGFTKPEDIEVSPTFPPESPIFSSEDRTAGPGDDGSSKL